MRYKPVRALIKSSLYETCKFNHTLQNIGEWLWSLTFLMMSIVTKSFWHTMEIGRIPVLCVILWDSGNVMVHIWGIFWSVKIMVMRVGRKTGLIWILIISGKHIIWKFCASVVNHVSIHMQSWRRIWSLTRFIQFEVLLKRIVIRS